MSGQMPVTAKEVTYGMVAAVSVEVGCGSGAWDTVDAREIVAASYNVVAADRAPLEVERLREWVIHHTWCRFARYTGACNCGLAIALAASPAEPTKGNE